jgi:hypothetical protein
MIYAYQPATTGKTPTNATILDQTGKPSPDVSILSIGRIRGALPNVV